MPVPEMLTLTTINSPAVGVKLLVVGNAALQEAVLPFIACTSVPQPVGVAVVVAVAVAVGVTLIVAVGVSVGVGVCAHAGAANKSNSIGIKCLNFTVEPPRSLLFLSQPLETASAIPLPAPADRAATSANPCS